MRKSVKRTIAAVSAAALSVSMIGMGVNAVKCTPVNGTNITTNTTKRVCINSNCYIVPNCYTVKCNDFKKILEGFGFCFKQNSTNNNCNTQQKPNTKPNITPVIKPTNPDTDITVKPNTKPNTTPTTPTTPTTKPDTNTNNTNTNTNTNQNDYVVSEYEKEVVRLVNEIRVKNGLSELKLNTKLSKVARIKSQDMKDNNYFSHTSPTYGSPFDMMKSFGITYRTAGENIAMGQRSPEAVVNAWMNSEGHRANILNASYKEIGVGYVASGNYWTQQFIG